MRRRHLFVTLMALSLISPFAPVAQNWVPPLEMADPGEHGIRIQDDGVLGNFLPAPGDGKKPAILVLGGSEGGLSSGALNMAKALQAAGFNVLQQSYYRAPGQPAAFSRIPLETFDRGIAWLTMQPRVDSTRIGIVGASKGAEAALAVASRNPAIKAVVAGMPSSVIWPAFSWDGSNVPGASWSMHGKDVPCLPYGPFNAALGIKSIYVNGLLAAPSHSAAQIEIEKSQAPVLLVCGKADTLWPSCPMATMLEQRDPRVKILSYTEAGHAVFGPPLADDSKSLPMLAALGGSPEGNNAARKDSWPKVINFLKSALAE